MPTIDVTYELLADGVSRIAIIQFDDPASNRPVTWDGTGLVAFADALDAVAAVNIDAVVLRGSAHSFGAGADLSVLAGISDSTEGTAVARLGWHAFRTLADLPVPSFALLTGYALGGGFELAMFADYRVAHAGMKGLGLPEVGLGVLPGWGGVYTLAHRVGPATALNIALFDSLDGRFVSVTSAAELGIVDQVLPADAWDDGWRSWVAQTLAEQPGRRESPARRPSAEFADAAIAARQKLALRRGPRSLAAPAVIRLLEDAERLGLDDAADVTSRLFGELAASDQAKTLMYSERILRTRGRASAIPTTGTARPIHRAAVIGAGLMASQLATLIVQHARIPVVLTDVSAQRAEAGAARVRERLAKAESSGRLAPGDAATLGALVTGSADPAAIGGADFVIEAIFEELEAKRAAFAEAEKWISPTAILATNTSSLSITALASGLAHPERVVGFHVFNPVSVVPLVEIIPTNGADVGFAAAPGAQAGAGAGAQSGAAAAGPLPTSADTVATVLAFAGVLKRRAVISADRPGFIVNRVLTRLLDVVTRAIDAGHDPLEVDAALGSIGLPMTPLQLLDFVGPAVQLHVSETMHAAYPDRFAEPLWLQRVVAASSPGSPIRVLQPTGELTAEAVRQLPTPSSEAERVLTDILADVLDAVAEEIRIMLAEGVAQNVLDIDLSLLLGANYPRTNGGITPYLDQTGASVRTNGRDFHTFLATATQPA